MIGRMRTLLLGLGPRQIDPLLSRFEGGEPAVRARLHAIVHSFVHGYHLGLAAVDVEQLRTDLEDHPLERRGFAYEGAGMGVGMRVQLSPGSGWFTAFLAAADAHHYMVQIGAGWALAKVPVRHDALIAQCDARYHWLLWDGYGFCEALFDPAGTVDRHRRPRRDDYALRAFDHGVGRALWFLRTADPQRISLAVQGFPDSRRRDLWGGVGLAAAYAGGVGADVLDAVREAAGDHLPELRVGAVLAAMARHRAGNAASHTDLAVERLCARDPSETVARAFAEEAAVSGGGAYAALRARIGDWLA